jgi:hypothetical protein
MVNLQREKKKKRKRKEKRDNMKVEMNSRKIYGGKNERKRKTNSPKVPFTKSMNV